MSDKKNIQLDDNLVKGSVWMSIGSIISRLIGALYIIPWIIWMGGGDTGAGANALYQLAYTPYSFFISLATAGVPSAISKQVSYYNALEEYEISKSIYRQSSKLMIITGVISAILMFIMAPVIAKYSPSSNISDATIVIRSISPALLIIPLQSATRGFIQGHNRMNESAISQIVEQIARVTFVLTAVYLIRIINNGSIVMAVSFSTLGALVGAIVSFIYLIWRLNNTSTVLKLEYSESKNKLNISTNHLLKEIIKDSIPFIISATTITVIQLLDQQTYAPLMEKLHYLDKSNIQITYGLVQGNAYRFSMLLISFGVAISTASIPFISNLMANKNSVEIKNQIEKVIFLLMFIMFPISIGFSILANPIYTLFYGYNSIGVNATILFGIGSLIISLYIVLSNILLAANLKRAAIIIVLISYLIKIILQPLGIYFHSYYGMITSSLITFCITSCLMIYILHKYIKLSVKKISTDILPIIIISLLMGVSCWCFKLLLDNLLGQKPIILLISTIIVTLLGITIYVLMSLKAGILDKVIGKEYTNMLRRYLKFH